MESTIFLMKFQKDFGENNNQNYKYAEEKLGMISHDYFW